MQWWGRCVCPGRVCMWELSMLSTQCCCEHNTALKSSLLHFSKTQTGALASSWVGTGQREAGPALKVVSLDDSVMTACRCEHCEALTAKSRRKRVTKGGGTTGEGPECPVPSGAGVGTYLGVRRGPLCSQSPAARPAGSSCCGRPQRIVSPGS